MPHTPEDGTFGEWMRGGRPLPRYGESRAEYPVIGEKPEPVRTVEVIPAGRTWATRDEVLVDTPRKKAVLDQLGNVVTERTDERGGYHRDVRINLR
jgi:hypothetical protein